MRNRRPYGFQDCAATCFILSILLFLVVKLTWAVGGWLFGSAEAPVEPPAPVILSLEEGER
ncbi:MAG: hypothetical protein DWQ01_08665 [Planctomycetota bacterium]|nr:MAG: hypothetical protein DWQ01_08665 [Planctomycetota bacterium]